MVLPLLVGTRFQVLFHSPLGVLFTFPSRYLFTIGRWRVFSLARWSSQIPAGLHVSCGTQVPSTACFPVLTGLSPSMACLSMQFHSGNRSDKLKALQPHESRDPWFGLVPVRSPLLGESLS
jgi:hypothetical protein